MASVFLSETNKYLLNESMIINKQKTRAINFRFDLFFKNFLLVLCKIHIMHSNPTHLPSLLPTFLLANVHCGEFV